MERKSSGTLGRVYCEIARKELQKEVTESLMGDLLGSFDKGAYITLEVPAVTLNRRFFETQFPGFFTMVRRDADRDMELIFKSARGTYTAQRITRVTANELHLQVQEGRASHEVMVPFLEIQEVVLKHKDA